jgi:hypothetical protein
MMLCAFIRNYLSLSDIAIPLQIGSRIIQSRSENGLCFSVTKSTHAYSSGIKDIAYLALYFSESSSKSKYCHAVSDFFFLCLIFVRCSNVVLYGPVGMFYKTICSIHVYASFSFTNNN